MRLLQPLRYPTYTMFQGLDPSLEPMSHLFRWGKVANLGAGPRIPSDRTLLARSCKMAPRGEVIDFPSGKTT